MKTKTIIKFCLVSLLMLCLPINSYAQSFENSFVQKSTNNLGENSKNLKSTSLKTGSLFSTWSATKILVLAALGSAVAVGGVAGGGGGVGTGLVKQKIILLKLQ